MKLTGFHAACAVDGESHFAIRGELRGWGSERLRGVRATRTGIESASGSQFVALGPNVGLLCDHVRCFSSVGL